MASLVAELHSRFRQAGVPDAHRLGQIGDEELIFAGPRTQPMSVSPERRRQPGAARGNNAATLWQHPWILRRMATFKAVSSSVGRRWNTEDTKDNEGKWLITFVSFVPFVLTGPADWQP